MTYLFNFNTPNFGRVSAYSIAAITASYISLSRITRSLAVIVLCFSCTTSFYYCVLYRSFLFLRTLLLSYYIFFGPAMESSGTLERKASGLGMPSFPMLYVLLLKTTGVLKGRRLLHILHISTRNGDMLDTGNTEDASFVAL